jgi:hypothetical protein
VATERLIIENFKGIKDLEIEVKPFMVLTGPQSVGKSTTAKLLHFFKTIPKQLETVAIRDAGLKREGNSMRGSGPSPSLISEFFRLLPPSGQTEEKSEIHYSSGANSFSLTGERDLWNLQIPKTYTEEFAKSVKAVSMAVNQSQEVMQTPFSRAGRSLYIPAGRAFYAQVEKDPVSFFGAATLDPSVADFGKFYARVRNFPTPGVPMGLAREARTLAEQLLGGTHRRENDRDFIELPGGQRLSPGAWSSGQQESLPLALILEKCISQDHPLRDVTSLFVEEPEAHLYPTSQRTIVQLLALAFNAMEGKANFFITTHSPYVLSTLNNLLKAGELFGHHKSNGKRKAVSKLVAESIALSPDAIGVYYMDRDGCHTMIDDETGLIDGRGIDDVSEEIAENFDALLDVE